ncbi:hypothetical protein RP20_CCG008128 [Aedes albopictus]|nr:uncharacterized protein LOC109622122 [Aedes albopictus]KXJ83160.1 hypothetical protein RP20_CCG008128 [Aedes albopictus]
MKCLLLLFALFVYEASGANASDAVFKDDLCLNGSRDQNGKCVCTGGYVEYRGSCFLMASPAANTASTKHLRQNRSCPPGYSDHQGSCVPKSCSGTICESACQPGYVLNAGFCEPQNPKCPTGTYYKNGYCYYQAIPPQTQTAKPIETMKIVPPWKLDIPVPEYIDPLDPNEVEEGTEPNSEDDDNDIEVVPDRRPHPGKNVVNNLNTVNSPTNVTSHNINNVYVHITRHKSDGSIKTVVIRNNETTVYEEKPPQKTLTEKPVEPTTTEEPQPDKCCIIVSPRICRQQQDEWVCFHRKHYRCGSFCTSNVMYLKPRRPFYHGSSLIMPPTMNYSSRMRFGLCRWGICPSVDCSGCLQGSYRCHIQCYTYDCVEQGDCNFVNQEEYCDDNDDVLCSPVEK